MQITEARLKRIMVVRLEEGERLPDCIESLARKKKIRSALVLLLGGARAGTLVVGPAGHGRPKAVLTASFGRGRRPGPPPARRRREGPEHPDGLRAHRA